MPPRKPFDGCSGHLSDRFESETHSPCSTTHETPRSAASRRSLQVARLATAQERAIGQRTTARRAIRIAVAGGVRLVRGVAEASAVLVDGNAVLARIAIVRFDARGPARRARSERGSRRDQTRVATVIRATIAVSTGREGAPLLLCRRSAGSGTIEPDQTPHQSRGRSFDCPVDAITPNDGARLMGDPGWVVLQAEARTRVDCGRHCRSRRIARAPPAAAHCKQRHPQ